MIFAVSRDIVFFDTGIGSHFYGRCSSVYGTLLAFIWAPYACLRALFEFMGDFLLFMGAMTALWDTFSLRMGSAMAHIE